MKKRNRTILFFLLSVVIILIMEIISRFYFGLGDPPLSVADDELDYVFAPNQKCRRFGNCIVYNDASMRCDFDVYENQPEDCRIYIVGDSVVNGGVLTDHASLATTILQEKLDSSRRRIQVCNVSAGSWGPGNYWAYFKKHFSLIGPRDILILEINSHDLWEDDPKIEGGNIVGRSPSYPARKPVLALVEGIERYLLPRIKKWLFATSQKTKIDLRRDNDDMNSDMVAYNVGKIKDLLSLPFAKKLLLIHRTRAEAGRKTCSAGEREIMKIAGALAVPVEVLVLDPTSDYRDSIHLNQKGQFKMFEALYDILENNK